MFCGVPIRGNNETAREIVNAIDSFIETWSKLSKFEKDIFIAETFVVKHEMKSNETEEANE